MRQRLAGLCLLALALPTAAQQAPDAGQLLREERAIPSPLPATPAIDWALPAETSPPPAGGPQVVVQRITLRGITRFAEAELLAVLGEFAGKSYDLAGLRGLADRLTAYYRQAGYPFARAFIPVQPITEGNLVIDVVEGRYGKVQAQGERAEAAQAFLSELTPGEVITSSGLERRLALLADLPGLRVTPILRPGQEIGTGDLVVHLEPGPKLQGDVGVDNHGNRFTGAVRARANLQWNGPFVLGDQLSLRGILSEADLWQGALTYSLPLGSSGLRGQVSYARTDYELGKEFESLAAHGTAKTTSLTLAYPFVRSRMANLSLAWALQHKALTDRQDATATRNAKASDALLLTLPFDRRDATGLSWGSLAYTTGRLKLDATLAAQDSASGMDSRGHFSKWNLDVARWQSTPLDKLALYGRLSAQWADKNLDSSEGFSLGGPTGVRAYPSSEGHGDAGWLIQIEARYRLGAFEPYLFYDAGRARINADNGRLIAPLADNTRAIAGAGVGLRWQEGVWSLDASLAWRNRGGRPTSDTRNDEPRLWATLAYRF